MFATAPAPVAHASHAPNQNALHAPPCPPQLWVGTARPRTPGLQGSFVHSRTDSAASLASLAGSLVFELDEDHEVETTLVARLPSELQRLDVSAGNEAQLWVHAMEAKEQLCKDSSDSSVDIKDFAQALAERGHITYLRHGSYTCPADTGMGVLKHTFVVVSLPGPFPGQPTYCVVDPNYKDHFKVSGRDTEAYNQMLDLLPSVFVGGAERLAHLVHVMCKEMEKVFSARGVPLPPWRTPRVMQGRWLVNQAQDIQVLPSCLPSRTSSAELN